MDIIIYGLVNCDTCRKARKALPGAQFRDVRTDPLSGTERSAFLTHFGDKLINRASTTWRGLSDDTRQNAPDVLLAENPALMKRPVIKAGAALYLGWTAEVRRELGVE